MFSQEVLRCIAAGVGTEMPTLLEGIDLQAKGGGAAHLCTYKLAPRACILVVFIK